MTVGLLYCFQWCIILAICWEDGSNPLNPRDATARLKAEEERPEHGPASLACRMQHSNLSWRGREGLTRKADMWLPHVTQHIHQHSHTHNGLGTGEGLVFSALLVGTLTGQPFSKAVWWFLRSLPPASAGHLPGVYQKTRRWHKSTQIHMQHSEDRSNWTSTTLHRYTNCGYGRHNYSEELGLNTQHNPDGLQKCLAKWEKPNVKLGSRTSPSYGTRTEGRGWYSGKSVLSSDWSQVWGARGMKMF